MRPISIVVTGHVDHGKSTLIGRLLLDLGQLHESKISEVRASSARRGGPTEWSYVLDSLQEERDQAITIDTTRIWFGHADKRFLIIDAPGHRQFLANMLSGAADADVAILVVDAQSGIEQQTVRHAHLLAFLGIERVLIAINKIDLLQHPQERVAQIERDLQDLLPVPPIACIPISAMHGDNVALRSARLPWYDGPTIAEALAAFEQLPAPLARALRLPIQDVYRQAGERIAVGTVATGSIGVGDEVVSAPNMTPMRVKRIVRWPQDGAHRALAGEPIGIVFDGDMFVKRGDVVATARELPAQAQSFGAEFFWLDDAAPIAGERLRIKCGTQDEPIAVNRVSATFDIDASSLVPEGARAQYNIVHLALRSSQPLALYARSADPAAARCILLRGSRVVGIGFVVSAEAQPAVAPVVINRTVREARFGHEGAVFWMTGLSGAGKSTIAAAAERRLFTAGFHTIIIDGDQLRSGLNADLGFSAADRTESVRRASHIASLLARNGTIAIVSLISPFAVDRHMARQNVAAPFYEIFIDTPLALCEERDAKGLYSRARAGEIAEFTGISSPYERPEKPALSIQTAHATSEECAEQLCAFIKKLVVRDVSLTG